jgi:plasmid stability protein
MEMCMGQIIIRNLDDAVLAQLKKRAAEQGLSLEESLRRQLAGLAHPSKAELLAEVDRIASMSPHRNEPPFAEDLIREGRDER